MSVAARLIVASLLVVVAAGCGPGGGPGAPSNPSSGPFGPPDVSTALAPFDGAWVLDHEKTLAAMRAGGAHEGHLEAIRKSFAAGEKETPFHPNLNIVGNVAMGDDHMASEYRFFRIHKHGAKACCVAWHHEDRFDPGDMSKCYVRLELVGAELHMDVFMVELPPAIDDPDLVSGAPIEIDAAECRFDSQTTNDPEHWQRLVFRRP